MRDSKQNKKNPMLATVLRDKLQYSNIACVVKNKKFKNLQKLNTIEHLNFFVL